MPNLYIKEEKKENMNSLVKWKLFIQENDKDKNKNDQKVTA